MSTPIPTYPARYAGAPIDASVWESDVTKSVQFLTAPPHFIGVQGVAQSIPASTWTALSLDTEAVDSYNGHSTSSNTSRWTCPAGMGGWYTACGIYVAAQNATGNRGARLQVNGNPIAGAAAFVLAAGATNATGISTPTRDVRLTPGDYIEVAGWQGSGGALNTAVFGDITTALWLRFSHAL